MMRLSPSEEVEVIESRPPTPESAFSRTSVISCSTSLGPAPAYVVNTTSKGRSVLGNMSMGSVAKDATPMPARNRKSISTLTGFLTTVRENAISGSPWRQKPGIRRG